MSNTRTIRTTKTKIVIIGGGAAGLTAAIAAARQGAEVVILERLSRVGKKLLATGNGRCNYTNTNIDISRYHGSNPKFAMGILNRFGTHETLDFFRELGIVPMEEQKGKVFPRSGQAGSVLDVLRFELERLGVETVVDAEVVGIEATRQRGKTEQSSTFDRVGKTGQIGNNVKGSSSHAPGDSPGFTVKTADGKSLTADAVIIAAGGKASPNLGSNGSGYALAESFGHTVVPLFPALVQLKLRADFLKQLAGIKVDGRAEILGGGRLLAADEGEILFTTYGISGPPILQISRAASELLHKGETPQVRLNITPDLSRDELEALLFERLETQAHKPLDFSFVGFLNKQLAPVVIRAAGISDFRKPAAEVSAKERQQLLGILQDWRIEITGTLPWSQAQVTAGGVDTKEIDPKTMESRLVPGIYFAGEIVDIDGDSGGFNLQWAWASGWIAGTSAAK